MCEVSGVYLKQKQSLTLCSREEVKFTNITFRNNSAMKTGFGGIALRNVNLMVTDYNIVCHHYTSTSEVHNI